MRMRVVLPLAFSLLAPLAAVAPPAQAACAPASSKFVGGTVKGQNGLDVNVQIGFSIVTAAGKSVGLNGCPISGYSHNIFLNRTTSYLGKPHGPGLTNVWKIPNLPSNAAYVWIETWPRNEHGALDYRKYAGSLRRKIPLNRNDTRVTLPVVCSNGGNTGTIWGKSFDRFGKPALITRIHAWSEAPDSNSFVMGFGPGKGYNGNYYAVNNLAPGQRYTILASAADKRVARVLHVTVNACKTTPLTIKLP